MRVGISVFGLQRWKGMEMIVVVTDLLNTTFSCCLLTTKIGKKKKKGNENANHLYISKDDWEKTRYEICSENMLHFLFSAYLVRNSFGKNE